MIEVIQGLPAHVTAFRATGTVTRDDYRKIINPLVKSVAAASNKINYLLVLNTSLRNYTAGAWIEDALLGIRHFTKWKKLAIVTEKDTIRKFTDTFGKLIPPKTKGFEMRDLILATQWISEL